LFYLFIYLFVSFFLMALGFELRASCLLAGTVLLESLHQPYYRSFIHSFPYPPFILEGFIRLFSYINTSIVLQFPNCFLNDNKNKKFSNLKEILTKCDIFISFGTVRVWNCDCFGLQG
jgi:hypothetical protein